MTEQYLSDFDFDLPEELIAQFPLEQRDNCRLLHVVPEGGYEDLLFHDIKKLLRPGDLLVMNNTFVIKARLRGHKATGGAVEALIERVTGEKSAIAMMRASKSPKAGTEVIFENHEGEKLPVKVGEREGEFFELEFPDAVLPLLILSATRTRRTSRPIRRFTRRSRARWPRRPRVCTLRASSSMN